MTKLNAKGRGFIPKMELPRGKVVLGVLWYHLVRFDLVFLNRNRALIADLYRQHLPRVHGNILRKHPAFVNRRNSVLLFINARSHSARITPESRSLQNALNDKKISQENRVKTFVENLLSLKSAEFYKRGINKLPNK